jgi:hypothetical protein
MRNLTVVVCIDDRGGMMFNKRRQSRDRVLIQELVESVEGKIYINSYSTLLFESHTDRVEINENPLKECPSGAVCFIENLTLAPHLMDISTLIVYKWNKKYPSDVRLDIDIKKEGFKLLKTKEFQGSSHDKITKEIYIR